MCWNATIFDSRQFIESVYYVCVCVCSDVPCSVHTVYTKRERKKWQNTKRPVNVKLRVENKTTQRHEHEHEHGHEQSSRYRLNSIRLFIANELTYVPNHKNVYYYNNGNGNGKQQRHRSRLCQSFIPHSIQKLECTFAHNTVYLPSCIVPFNGHPDDKPSCVINGNCSKQR